MIDCFFIFTLKGHLPGWHIPKKMKQVPCVGDRIYIELLDDFPDDFDWDQHEMIVTKVAWAIGSSCGYDVFVSVVIKRRTS